ncbi:Fasciclin domain-containing protein [Neurospora tetraspora]|uniref:Fasciclin domain-containing protein n=1 Tax=Neurospora tetraspora TaxID=94610 RepID=A0AAE0MXS2_9PEZI|nr:Fasciclin domain-containing protein [Neurospora tetraspora]
MKQQLLPLFAAGAAALYVPFLGVKEKQLLSIEVAEDSIGKNLLSNVQDCWDDSASSIYSSLIEKHIIEELEDTLHKDHKHHDHDHDHDHDDDGDHGRHGRHGHHPPGDANKSIYELIKESKYSERFANIVDEHDDIKRLLNNTDGNNKHNYTIFVPTDKAFERFPHHPDHPPPEEVVRHILQHHIIPYRRPIFHDHRRHHDHSQEEEQEDQDLFHTLTFPHLLPSLHTLPTELHSPLLDHRPQRLRLSTNPLFFGHGRVRVNFVNRVVMPDIYASNGLIHAVDGILVPPPPALKGVSLLPSLFSTFSLALEKTGLGEELGHGHGHDDNDENDDVKQKGGKKMGGGEKEGKGGTLFAPTNRAFARLGPRLNAFLFNTERGKKYLKAILKYHFVPGQTVYSDAYYKAGSDDDKSEEYTSNCPHNCPPTHYDLPTLLSEDARLGVDIKNWRGYTIMVVNGFNRPSVLDGPAEDGVIHVVSSVLIPPRRGNYGDEKEEGEVGEMSVEELVARLEPYMKEEEESERPHSGDL